MASYNGDFLVDGQWRDEVEWDMSKPLALTVRYTTPRPWKLDRTVLRLKTPKLAFGIAVDDLLGPSPVWMADAGVYAAGSGCQQDLQAYLASIAGKQTILEKVQEKPDQSFAGALESNYRPQQNRSSTLLSLGWDNRKLRMDRNGTIRFGAPLSLTHYQIYWRYYLTPKLGTGHNLILDGEGAGVVPGYSRKLEAPDLPVPVIRLDEDGVVYGERAYVAPFGAPRSPEHGGPWLYDKPVAVAEYTVTNTTDSAAEVSLQLDLVDNQYADPGTVIGVYPYTEIHMNPKYNTVPTRLEAVGDRVVATSTEGFVAVFDGEGAPGLACQLDGGKATWTGQLAPGASVKVVAYAPLEWQLPVA